MLYVFAIVLFFAVLANAKITREGEVLVLDDSNFSEALAQHNLLLVEFYAPWCGHCKNLAPEWSKAAVTAKDLPIKLSKVDATVAQDLAKQYNIQGYPTIKFFKNGNAVDYDGGRTEKEIVAWINKKSGPPAKSITTHAELLKLQEENEAIAVGIFKDAIGANAQSFIAFASNSNAESPFAITTSDEIRKKLGVKEDSIVILKNFDDKRNDFTVGSSLDHAAFEKFLSISTTPEVLEYNAQNSKKIFGSNIKKHSLLFLDKSKDNTAVLAGYNKLAKEYKGNLIFVIVPTEEAGIMNYFGVTKETTPTLFIADMTTSMRKFLLDGEVNETSMRSHLQGFFSGTLKPHLKSEEPAPEDRQSAVKVVKGKSFEDIVLNSKENVMFEIYAPWCGHCKKLAPIYDEIAEELATTDPHIILAKMDGTANEIDVEGFGIEGYPTLFFVPAATKKPIKYNGTHDKSQIIEFMKNNIVNVEELDEKDEL